MCGGEGVVDKDVAERRELAHEIGIVAFLAAVKPGILEAKNIAGAHRIHGGRRFFPDAILGESDGPVHELRELLGNRPQRILRIAPLRPAEMREQDDLAALVGDLGDGRDHALHAGCVGHLAVCHRHTEVDAHEHAFVLHVGLVERAERGHARGH